MKIEDYDPAKHDILPENTYRARMVAITKHRGRHSHMEYIKIKRKIISGPYKDRTIFECMPVVQSLTIRQYRLLEENYNEVER